MFTVGACQEGAAFAIFTFDPPTEGTASAMVTVDARWEGAASAPYTIDALWARAAWDTRDAAVSQLHCTLSEAQRQPRAHVDTHVPNPYWKGKHCILLGARGPAVADPCLISPPAP